MSALSPLRRRTIVDALRRGTVPQDGLDVLAVGLDRLAPALDEELRTCATGGAVFKAVRGDYGSGKTFLSRWLAERARREGFATAEVQISETETPLHRLETVYRRLVERLATADRREGALRSVVDGWFFALEDEAIAAGATGSDVQRRADELAEERLARVADQAPTFAAALRGYRRARIEGRAADADGLLAWASGQPNIAASVKRQAGIRGDLDHFGALGFLEGLLVVLRDAGFAGLLVVLDEIETLQRARSDVRERSLNALRQLVDEVDAGRFPGLYLAITGTPAFFDGPSGVQRLQPLAQRLHVDFQTDARFDNPRAVQVRLRGFDLPALEEVGRRVRDVYADGQPTAERIGRRVDDAYVAALARAVAGELGGKVGVAPRIFLKKLVGDVLDRVDQFEDFDPRVDYAPHLVETELAPAERRARAAETADDVELDL